MRTFSQDMLSSTGITLKLASATPLVPTAVSTLLRRCGIEDNC
jgi:hypothetical protein